jgi:hypothetical protein
MRNTRVKLPQRPQQKLVETTPLDNELTASRYCHLPGSRVTGHAVLGAIFT